MSKFYSTEEQILPRPVERLPEYANAKARRNLAEKLVQLFPLSEQAANTIANAVVDPTSVRKSIGEADDPQVEKIPVPGGTLFGMRTHVWARRIMPDPRNPRIGPSRRHQFAVDPGTAGDDCKFRPVPEPRSPDDQPETRPELVVEIDSRPHLEWASAQAAKWIRAENDWRASIASQGVMEAVWLVATTFVHADGSAPETVVTTAEGSSRATAVHELLNINSSAVPYEDPDAKLRGIYKKLNEALETGTPTGEQQVALRCERMPALILVGFKRHATGTAGFPTAVKSMVALRHVDPPKPWGEGPENESLADEVLDELYRRNLITATEREYLAGSCTKAEAKKAHLSDDPTVRAAKVVELFARPEGEDGQDDRMEEAIRVAVTSQSTRKRITGKLCNELAAALIVRSLAADNAKRDQVRRYLRHAFGKAIHEQKWACTDRDTDTLEQAALHEVRTAIGDGLNEPGPATLELSVRAAYPLIVAGALNADRGSKGNDQSDRRTPGEVLNVMRRKIQGVRQLAQALRDYAAGQPVRAVNEEGEVLPRADGSGDQLVSDVYLREQYPPSGKARAKTGGSTPSDILRDRVVDFTNAMSQLETAFRATCAVTGGDGSPLVDIDGVDSEECVLWSQLLSDILGELRVWEKTYRRKHGVTSPRVINPAPDAHDDEYDGYRSDEDDTSDFEDEREDATTA
jgi:hypothetical protein